MRQELKDALVRRALGYDTEEIVEEDREEEGEPLLIKRKVTKKSVPPDLAAIRLLLEEREETPVPEMTDEELAAEKARLMAQLKEWEEKSGKEKKGG